MDNKDPKPRRIGMPPALGAPYGLVPVDEALDFEAWYKKAKQVGFTSAKPAARRAWIERAGRSIQLVNQLQAEHDQFLLNQADQISELVAAGERLVTVQRREVGQLEADLEAMRAIGISPEMAVRLEPRYEPVGPESDEDQWLREGWNAAIYAGRSLAEPLVSDKAGADRKPLQMPGEEWLAAMVELEEGVTVSAGIPDRYPLAADVAPVYGSYTTTPGESVAGIALRQLKDESRWVEIRDLNAHAFPCILAHEYYPVGTVLRLPAQPAAADVVQVSRDEGYKAAMREVAAHFARRDGSPGVVSSWAISRVRALLATNAQPVTADVVQVPRDDVEKWVAKLEASKADGYWWKVAMAEELRALLATRQDGSKP